MIPKTNGFYEFSLYSNSTLGTTFKNAKMLGELSYELAIKFENVVELQRQMQSKLPEGTPLDHSKYTYYMFDVEGRHVVVADVWVVPKSMRQQEGLSYHIQIDSISPTDMAVVRDQLRLLGVKFIIT